MTYIRALGTIANVEIYRGVLSHEEQKRTHALRVGAAGKYKPLSIVKTEEKGSDVNLATHLLCDAFRDNFDVAAVISNDTDLEEPLRVVKEEIGKGLVLLHPSKYASGNLGKYATAVRRLRAGALKAAQFPEELTDSIGTFRKPASW